MTEIRMCPGGPSPASLFLELFILIVFSLELKHGYLASKFQLQDNPEILNEKFF